MIRTKEEFSVKVLNNGQTLNFTGPMPDEGLNPKAPKRSQHRCSTCDPTIGPALPLWEATKCLFVQTASSSVPPSQMIFGTQIDSSLAEITCFRCDMWNNKWICQFWEKIGVQLKPKPRGLTRFVLPQLVRRSGIVTRKGGWINKEMEILELN
ncbi:unnamed protein product, partial [Mesorhabditis belari]|uniref:Uncharacterized protein n=1 Tax=Mesorhabditis belari TaxID=2138241 RepID=A0AAF3JBC6_9BILA